MELDLQQIKQVRDKLIRGSELLNILDSTEAELTSLKTRLDVLQSIETPSRDDLKGINLLPERIKQKDEVLRATQKMLLEEML